MRIPLEHLTIWVAGFYEGEGSIHCQISKKWDRPGILWTIFQKDPEPLDWVENWLQIIGCDRYTLRFIPRDNAFEMRVSFFPEILMIYNHLQEYLSIRRRDQFSNAIDLFLEHSVKYGNGRPRKIPNSSL